MGQAEAISNETARPAAERHLAQLVLGVSEPNGTASMIEAHRALTGEQLSAEEFVAEFERVKAGQQTIDLDELSRADFERRVSFRILTQIFEDGDLTNNSVLRNFPLYAHMYRTYAKPRGGLAPNSDVLLLGALSSVTSHAFVVEADKILGTTEEHAHIVDLHDDSDKTRHGAFVRGDVRQLRYAAESFGLVQTNHLFDQIGVGGWLSPKVAKLADSIKAMHEAFRVLKPGGHLLLCESPIGYEFKSQLGQASPYNQERTDALRKMIEWLLPYEIGFENVQIEPAWVPHGVDWLFDKTLEFDETKFPRRVVPGTLAVYAQKPFEPRTTVPEVLQ